MADLERYVTTTIDSFRTDHRVLWWEVYNEPVLTRPFSAHLRDVAYTAASKVVNGATPVLACWSDNNDTDVIDLHAYTPNFAKDWEPALFSNPRKSALVTEAGSRWVSEGSTPTSDQGSPLLVLHYLNSLAPRGKTAPGVMINWELMASAVSPSCCCLSCTSLALLRCVASTQSLTHSISRALTQLTR